MSAAPFIGELISGNLPEMAGTCSGPCTVIGPSRHVLDDLANYRVQGAVIAVTTMGIFYPKIDHWVMGVPRKMRAFKDARDVMRGTNGLYKTHAKAEGFDGKGIDVVWPVSGLHTPTAGHTAAVIACLLGYSPVILNGVAADNSGHFYPDSPLNPDGLEWLDYGSAPGKYRDAWLWLKDNFFEGRVKSVSGNTRAWFGEP